MKNQTNGEQKMKLQDTEYLWVKEIIDDSGLLVARVFQSNMTSKWSILKESKTASISIDTFKSAEMALNSLIAEAGTVANECGLTPSQLLEQRDELLSLTKKLKDDLAILRGSIFESEKVDLRWEGFTSLVQEWIDDQESLINKIKGSK